MGSTAILGASTCAASTSGSSRIDDDMEAEGDAAALTAGLTCDEDTAWPLAPAAVAGTFFAAAARGAVFFFSGGGAAGVVPAGTAVAGGAPAGAGGAAAEGGAT